jgi:hypothetical protein
MIKQSNKYSISSSKFTPSQVYSLIKQVHTKSSLQSHQAQASKFVILTKYLLDDHTVYEWFNKEMLPRSRLLPLEMLFYHKLLGQNTPPLLD